MTVLITMAGYGSRFADRGYSCPKYRIKANGKTIFEWSIISLSKFFNDSFIFACLDGDDIGWIKKISFELGVKDISFHIRSSVSQGQAETVYDALSVADPEAPLWIYNIDTHVAKGLKPSDMEGYKGCVPVFNCLSQNMSFVSYDSEGYIANIVEKKPISKWATVGLYGFESAMEFSRVYQLAYVDNNTRRVGGELYIAPIYQMFLAEHKHISAPQLDSDDVIILGTPEQLLDFDAMALPPFGA